jgi:hypothetical protein
MLWLTLAGVKTFDARLRIDKAIDIVVVWSEIDGMIRAKVS